MSVFLQVRCARLLLSLLMLIPYVTSKPHLLPWITPPNQQIVVDQSAHHYLPPQHPQQQEFYYHSGYLSRADAFPSPPVAQPPKGPVRLFFLSFHRFPWPVEPWVQRLQNYFSTYTVMPEPVVVEDVNIGPDIIPPDALDPEGGPSRPPSSPAVVTIELPNPNWSQQSVNEIPQKPQQAKPPKEPIVDVVQKPSWPSETSNNSLLETSTSEQETSTIELETSTSEPESSTVISAKDTTEINDEVTTSADSFDATTTSNEQETTTVQS